MWRQPYATPCGSTVRPQMYFNIGSRIGSWRNWCRRWAAYLAKQKFRADSCLRTAPEGAGRILPAAIADRKSFIFMRVPGLRSSYEKVGGIVYFGRMLDKIRLKAAGKLPEGYNVGTAKFTWFDARCTRFLGIDYDAVKKVTLEGGTDE